MAYYLVTDTDLAAIANKIRQKTGATGSLEFIADYLSEIEKLTDTRSANATASDILSGKTAYVNKVKITGNIATKTSSNVTVSGKNVTIPAGYYASQVTKSVADGTITNNTTLPSGKTSSGDINRGYYIKIGEGYHTEKYYYSKGATNGVITNNTSGGTSSGTINRGKQIKIGSGYYASDLYYTAQSNSGTKTISASGTTSCDGYTSVQVNAGTVTNNTSGGSSSGTINRGSQIKIGKGYYNSDLYYTAQSNSGTKTISSSGTISCDGYSNVSVAAGSTTMNNLSLDSSTGVVTASATVAAGYQGASTPSKTLQLSTQAAKTVTPTESSQTAVSAGKYTTGAITVGAISTTYVGSGITRRSSSDLTESNGTVTCPAGYYASSASKTVTTTPGSVTLNDPTINTSTGLVTSTASVTAGVVSAATPSKTLQLSTQAGYTVTPSESSQTAVAAGKYTTGAVTVGAISSTYVGSGVPKHPGQTIVPSKTGGTVGAGYYLQGNIVVEGVVITVSITVNGGATIGYIDINAGSASDPTSLMKTHIYMSDRYVAYSDHDEYLYYGTFSQLHDNPWYYTY